MEIVFFTVLPASKQSNSIAVATSDYDDYGCPYCESKETELLQALELAQLHICCSCHRTCVAVKHRRQMSVSIHTNDTAYRVRLENHPALRLHHVGLREGVHLVSLISTRSHRGRSCFCCEAQAADDAFASAELATHNCIPELADAIVALFAGFYGGAYVADTDDYSSRIVVGACAEHCDRLHDLAKACEDGSIDKMRLSLVVDPIF